MSHFTFTAIQWRQALTPSLTVEEVRLRKTERLVHGHIAGSEWWRQVATQAGRLQSVCAIHTEPWQRKPSSKDPEEGRGLGWSEKEAGV